MFLHTLFIDEETETGETKFDKIQGNVFLLNQRPHVKTRPIRAKFKKPAQITIGQLCTEPFNHCNNSKSNQNNDAAVSYK